MKHFSVTKRSQELLPLKQEELPLFLLMNSELLEVKLRKIIKMMLLSLVKMIWIESRWPLVLNLKNKSLLRRNFLRSKNRRHLLSLRPVKLRCNNWMPKEPRK
jgi:hypothetical protein